MGKKSTKENTGVERWIVLPDMQIPHIDKRSMNAVEQYMADHRWDGYINLGDFLDFNELSKFNIGYPGNVEERVATTFAMGREVLERHVKLVRAQNPKARMILIEGNHDYRVKDYTLRHPELEGFLDVEKNLNLKALKIEWADTWTTKQPVRIGKAGFLHGNKVGMYHAKMMVQNYCENVFYGHCVSEDTEVLTPDGWKGYKTLKPNTTQVATLNKATQQLEWNTVSAVHVRQYDKTFNLKTDGIDFRATDYHGMVGLNATRKKLELFSFEDFTKKAQRIILHGGELDRPNFPLSNEEIRLVAWICADSHLREDGHVVWGLKKERKIKVLRELLNTLGVAYLDVFRSGEQWISFSLKQLTKVWLLFGAKKRLPAAFKDLSSAQTKVLIQEYGITDGHTRGKSIRLYSTKQVDIELLQHLAVISGYRASMTIQHNELKNPDHKPLFVLNVNPRTTSVIYHKHAKLVPHPGGTVWCLTVPNGTVLFRRNGRTIITQNTHDIMEIPLVRHGHDNVVVGKSLGCLCNYDQRYLKGNPTKWQQAFSVFYFLPDGYFNEFTAKIFKHRFVSPEGKIYQG